MTLEEQARLHSIRGALHQAAVVMRLSASDAAGSLSVAEAFSRALSYRRTAVEMLEDVLDESASAARLDLEEDISFLVGEALALGIQEEAFSDWFAELLEAADEAAEDAPDELDDPVSSDLAQTLSRMEAIRLLLPATRALPAGGSPQDCSIQLAALLDEAIAEVAGGEQPVHKLVARQLRRICAPAVADLWSQAVIEAIDQPYDGASWEDLLADLIRAVDEVDIGHAAKPEAVWRYAANAMESAILDAMPTVVEAPLSERQREIIRRYVIGSFWRHEAVLTWREIAEQLLAKCDAMTEEELQVWVATEGSKPYPLEKFGRAFLSRASTVQEALADIDVDWRALRARVRDQVAIMWGAATALSAGAQ